MQLSFWGANKLFVKGSQMITSILPGPWLYTSHHVHFSTARDVLPAPPLTRLQAVGERERQCRPALARREVQTIAVGTEGERLESTDSWYFTVIRED